MITMTGRLCLLILVALMISALASAQEVSWWEPEEPEPGDLLTIYYDTDPGVLPPGNIKLHWGINQWTEPPESMWPPGTVVADPGQSVQTPLTFVGGTVWAVDIQTDGTVNQVDFVFTNGTLWDNNGGSDWHIYFGDPPALHWQRFTLDSRSKDVPYSVEELGTVYLKGDFNGWGDSMPLNGPDERGVYYYDVHLMEVSYGYKFHADGDNWMQDPDNPNTDGGMFNNSLVTPVAEAQPYMYGVRPFDGEVFPLGSNVEVYAKIYPSDETQAELTSVVLEVNGVERPEISFNVVTGELGGSLVGLDAGQANLRLIITDANAVTTERWWPIALKDQGVNGYLALDGRSDDDGTGTYTSPAPDHAADLLLLYLNELADGDSVQFSIHVEFVAPETRVMVQIANSLNGLSVTTPAFGTEVALPDFDGAGVQIALADPGSDSYDPEVHNRLVINREPTEYGPSVDLRSYWDGVIDFVVSVGDLEALLGSYSGEWYYSIYSFYEGFNPTIDHSWEIGLENGGIAEDYDPDAFDALFIDNCELQRILFSNHTSNRMATFDYLGRGIAAIPPEYIGPNVGSSGPVIRWLTRDWSTVQSSKTLYAELIDTNADVTLHHLWSDGSEIIFLGNLSGEFTYDATLHEGENNFLLEADDGEIGFSSVLTIFYETPQAPVALLEVSVDGNQIVLDATQSFDPQDQEISVEWTVDPDNPAPTALTGANSFVATFDTPEVIGEYYFDITLEDTDGNITNARTMVDINADGVEPFSLDKSADWVQDAIIYEIYVRSYDSSETLQAVTDDMQRIHDMGYTCIWFMPIHPGPSTHGYAITDYMGIEEDYGTLEDFAELVEVAHSYDIKIVLDQVINHSAIEHPWMQDAIARGEASNTWDWYDRDINGNYTYYFDWVSLPNLNYDNPDLRHYMIEMSKWWVEEYDIDGYRCDVAWGVQERYANFWPEWRTALKTIKPEVFLLAEANATDFTYLTDRFDSAYHWDMRHGSSNSFITLYSTGNTTPSGLQDRVMNYGIDWPDYTFPFRFMENHDEDRYITLNTPIKTKTAATMLLTIPGIPLVYAGQEVGEESQRGLIGWDDDPNQMQQHYETLIQLRNRLSVVRSVDQVQLNNDQGTGVYSYARYQEDENIVVVALNLTAMERVTAITLPTDDWSIEPAGDYYLLEAFSNDHNPVTGSQLATINYTLPGFSSAVWVISDTSFVMGMPESVHLPNMWSLDQNYPNPFNPATQIRFSLGAPADVKLVVYNVLGQHVATLVNEHLTAGSHTITFDGNQLFGNDIASGVYFYRLEAGEFVRSRKMVLLK